MVVRTQPASPRPAPVWALSLRTSVHSLLNCSWMLGCLEWYLCRQEKPPHCPLAGHNPTRLVFLPECGSFCSAVGCGIPWERGGNVPSWSAHSLLPISTSSVQTGMSVRPLGF